MPHPLRCSLLAIVLCASAVLACGHATAAQASIAAQPAAAARAAARPTADQYTLWIDVRTPAEFAQGHLQGAINIPLDEIARQIASHAPDKDTPIALYCHSGRRSGLARQILQGMGYTAVSNQGSYAELMRRGVQVQ